VTASISLLSNIAFTWFKGLTTVALFVWYSMCIAYTRFYSVFRFPWRPCTVWFSLALFSLIILSNDFIVFVHSNKS
jgi:hypothetical protein